MGQMMYSTLYLSCQSEIPQHLVDEEGIIGKGFSVLAPVEIGFFFGKMPPLRILEVFKSILERQEVLSFD